METYRLLAVAVGVCLLALPLVTKLLRAAKPALPMSDTEITAKDLETILHMAHRLRRLGCQDGAKACQALLDIMLNHGVR